MKELRLSLHSNHKKALDDYNLDIDGQNDGWTMFCNSEEKKKHPDCSKCFTTMIAEVEKIKDLDKKADLSVLKDCYKAVLVVPAFYPINMLDHALKHYITKFSESTDFYGKFGGSGREGSRVLLFYESLPEQTAEKKKQLVEVVEDLNMIGMINETRACEYMHDHVYLDERLKSKVRHPEIFLEKLKHHKKSFDNGRII